MIVKFYFKNCKFFIFPSTNYYFKMKWNSEHSRSSGLMLNKTNALQGADKCTKLMCIIVVYIGMHMRDTSFGGGRSLGALQGEST